ncbi:MAG: beta-N-acetylhexosaminidase [Acholeplasmatales bacterium]|jgi:hypothetical protein|nr:beta-N-acetylhexosaminidase [Acholeplasmataceae bacterium]MDY0115007.1 beta-N-acetylhexosaminidase [Acholeplasmatales bacterium]MCK9233726.1 beta-N-acetylhexosaminidase [Acholeplasmataceae bacterium]MCK9289008.1 beta-N-acetylhexosaminidase [Acholeplasmataceae bacterium]MCK9427703.1 beta-N-acetylhexosaminidase [Acholeplasmataceae bacterium]
MKEAINIVNSYGYEIKEPTEYIKGEETKLVLDTLYYKNIPEGLLYLINGEEELKNHFKKTATMIDLSRNAVFKLTYFKEVILKHALLGFNEIWLYMEDVFEIKELPKFGYLRGKYSKEELKELVDFSNQLGITLIPCVQTLGHMGQFLRWPSSAKFKDTSDVLKVGSEDTYRLITLMLKTLKEVFPTTKIHVGMDETFGLGFGRYYKEEGYTPQPKLFMEHLKKVNELALKEGFEEVYIWSDMFFRMYSKHESYYDYNIDFEESYLKEIPSNVGLVYWDYYNYKKEIVEGMVKKHLTLNKKIIFASGTWIWTKLTYDKTQTDRTALMHIDVSKEYGLEEICFTQWQDDGAYVDYDSIYLGLYDVINHIYDNKVKEDVFTFLTNKDYQDAVLISQLNDLKISPIRLLWDDIILAIYLNNTFLYEPNSFNEAIKELDDYIKKLKENKLTTNPVYNIANLLNNKLKLRQQLLKQYQDKENKISLAEELKELEKSVNLVLNDFKERWLSNYKVYGLEVLETRLIATISRIDTLRRIIEDYNNKLITQLDFLEEELSQEGYLTIKFADIFYSSTVK